MYSRFLDTLDAKSINGYVFGAELISREVKQQISNAATTKDGNEILLDHLYDTATKESLEEFASIVSGDKVSKKVQQLGKELQQKLRQLKEGSRYVTPYCALLYMLHCYMIMSLCLAVLPLKQMSHSTLTRMKNWMNLHLTVSNSYLPSLQMMNQRVSKRKSQSRCCEVIVLLYTYQHQEHIMNACAPDQHTTGLLVDF